MERIRKILIIAWVVLFVLLAVLAITLTVIDKKYPPKTPSISVRDIHPCSKIDDQGKYVDGFEVNDTKLICAEVETDTYPERLTMIVEPLDNLWDAHAYGTNIYEQRSQISFAILEELPVGVYRARIEYGRTTLASVVFSVWQK